MTKHLGLAAIVARRFHCLEFEDAMQEACLGLMRAAQTYDPAKGRLSTYSFLWMRTFCCRAMRRQNVRIRTPSDLWGPPYEGAAPSRTLESMLPSHATAPDDEASAHQLSAALLERIETLPPKLQHVIRGRFYEDQTLQEIGLELGVSRERVRQLECEALHLLRQKTEDLRGAI